MAAALMAVAGCSVSEFMDETTEMDQVHKVFRAGFETLRFAQGDNDAQGVATRTYFDDALHLFWTEDDRLTIFTSTLNQQYKFDGETGDNSGTFSQIASGQFGSGSAISTNYAVYPYSSSTKISYDEDITVVLPEVQGYASGTFGLGANTMVAVTKDKEDNFLPFKNVGGYLVLKLYGEGIVKSVSLSGNNGEKIAGKAVISASYGSNPSVVMDESATGTITIDCGEGVELGSTAGETTSFWFVIPPVTFSKGITIRVENTEGWSMTKSTSSSRTITRNVKNSLSPLKAEFDTKEGFVYIPDANFKAYIVDKYDTDEDGELSLEEADGVDVIECSNLSIESFRGIEAFQNLTELRCYDNPVTSIDVSSNAKLQMLICHQTELENIVIGEKELLTMLTIGYRSDHESLPLSSIDLSGCPSLKQLSLSQTSISELDLSHNPLVEGIYCAGNPVQNLDVSHNPNLTSLSFRGALLTTIDVSMLADLTSLDVANNHLTSLDVTHNPELTYLDCGGTSGSNDISELDLSNNTKLIELDCRGNNLTSLDLSTNLELATLRCLGNKIESLDLSKNVKLETLCVSSNNLSLIDISHNTALTYFECGNNSQITTLDVSANTLLRQLYFDNTSISAIDVTALANLRYLGFMWTPMSSIDLSGNPELIELFCRNTNLETLDLSSNPKLQHVGCHSCPNLSTITLKTGQTISDFLHDSGVTIEYVD